jgi:hypothetical protein
MNYPLIPYQFETVLKKFTVPNSKHLTYLDNRTKVAIANAWEKFTVLDNYGRVWINSKKVHILLRTNRDNAKYIIGGVPDSDKYRDGKELYIRGSSIYQILDYNIQNARSLQRENYIRFSELFYQAIRDCSRARELRAEFYEHLNRTIGYLKQRRINKFKLEYDELTGKPLNLKSCEFSHIRSVSLFPELAGLLENGLIINKITHDKITQFSINDENELLELCELEGWSTNWYDDFGKLNF